MRWRDHIAQHVTDTTELTSPPAKDFVVVVGVTRPFPPPPGRRQLMLRA